MNEIKRDGELYRYRYLDQHQYENTVFPIVTYAGIECSLILKRNSDGLYTPVEIRCGKHNTPITKRDLYTPIFVESYNLALGFTEGTMFLNMTEAGREFFSFHKHESNAKTFICEHGRVFEVYSTQGDVIGRFTKLRNVFEFVNEVKVNRTAYMNALCIHCNMKSKVNGAEVHYSNHIKKKPERHSIWKHFKFDQEAFTFTHNESENVKENEHYNTEIELWNAEFTKFIKENMSEAEYDFYINGTDAYVEAPEFASIREAILPEPVANEYPDFSKFNAVFLEGIENESL